MSRLARNPRRLVLLAFGLAIVAAAVQVVRSALDDRPIYAAAALPAPGTRVPSFRLPAVSGDTMTAGEFRGRPVLFALWSLDCAVSRRALAGIDLLRRDYEQRGVAVVLLADDGDATALRRVLDSARATIPVAYANGRLSRLFDHSRRAPERENYRVAFALPSFLVVGADGRVVDRAAGVSFDEIRSRDVRLKAVRGACSTRCLRLATEMGVSQRRTWCRASNDTTPTGPQRRAWSPRRWTRS